ncbi:organic cation transporter protein-like [Amphiura filiformis]|uniref:organic cation transporter protein-like n=1 Tax=Amphiura filiformis TaxID=82378 RepID=UPI003B20FB42
MEFDDALRLLGNFGKYQTILYLLLTYGYYMAGFILMGMIFIGGTPQGYHCTPPPGFSANETVPGFGEPDVVDSCHMYEVLNGTVTDNKIGCIYGWDYQAADDDVTYVMDFNLVCDDAVFAKLAKSVLIAGVMAGSITSGQVSDLVGRKVVLHVSFLADAICGIAMTLVGNYNGFLVFYFLFGFFQQGVLNSSYIMIAEMFSPESRAMATSMTSVVWGVAASLVAPVAFLFRNWKHYQLFISLLHLVGLSMWWIIPESNRWLISRGRIDEAERNLHKIAKFNGIDAPKHFLSENVILSKIETQDPKKQTPHVSVGYELIAQEEPQENGHVDQIEHTVSKTRPKRYNMIHVITSRILLRFFLIMAFCWFTNGIYYYGLSLNSALLKGNKYLNVFLGCWIELPSGIVTVLALKWMGRRPALSGSFILGGICCFAIAFLPNYTDSGLDLTPVIITVATIGKFWASFSFSMVYVYLPEIMPTVIRQVTLGGGSFSARIGAVLAPFLIFLGDFHDYLPMTILGILAVTAGIICLSLPETRNRALPDTIQEGEAFCKQNHFLPNCRKRFPPKVKDDDPYL